MLDNIFTDEDETWGNRCLAKQKNNKQQGSLSKIGSKNVTFTSNFRESTEIGGKHNMEEELLLQNAENSLRQQITGLKIRGCGILIWMNCLSFRYKTRTVWSPQRECWWVAKLYKSDSWERLARTWRNVKTSGHTFPWRFPFRYILESMLPRMYLSYYKANIKKKNYLFYFFLTVYEVALEIEASDNTEQNTFRVQHSQDIVECK